MLLAIATFPGIIMHEMAHLIFCRIQGIKVFKVCYFRLGNPAGYMLHDTPDSAFQHLLICCGPFFINTICGAVVAFPGALRVMKLHAGTPVEYFLLWLGISIAMHAFPSTGDAKSLLRSLWLRPTSIFAKLLGTPVALVIYIGALGSFFWLDLIYALAVVMAFPKLLTLLLRM